MVLDPPFCYNKDQMTTEKRKSSTIFLIYTTSEKVHPSIKVISNRLYSRIKISLSFIVQLNNSFSLKISV